MRADGLGGRVAALLPRRADWAEARFIVAAGTRPQTLSRPPSPKEAAVILTPKPGPEPRINGPKVYGWRPGNPFLYRIPTTGARPISFSAKGLPAGLNLDKDTGIVTGTVPPRGKYAVTFTAKNPFADAMAATAAPLQEKWTDKEWGLAHTEGLPLGDEGRGS